MAFHKRVCVQLYMSLTNQHQRDFKEKGKNVISFLAWTCPGCYRNFSFALTPHHVSAAASFLKNNRIEKKKGKNWG